MNFSLVFWIASLYNTLAIAVNRLLATYYPVAYPNWFSKRNTLLLISICWLLAVLLISVFFIDGCDFYYAPVYYSWAYGDTECGFWAGWIIDFGHGVFVILLIFVINVITGTKLKRSNRVGKYLLFKIET